MNSFLPFSFVVGVGTLVWACSDDDPAGTSGAGAGGAAPSTTTGQTSATTSSTGSGGGGGWDPRFDAFVEALQEDLAANDAYGVSVAIMEGGQITFAHAFGSKDPDGVEPLTPSTLMQIGSTTKQMTATALLRKVEAGDLALDDTMEATLPMLEFAQGGTWDDQLTAHHLISHQGGIYDLVDWAGSANDASLATFTYGPFANELFFMSPPGAFWNYSNPNFSLAGLVTEELDSRPWGDIMREDVFAPLGMNRTFTRKAEVEADGDFALSYGFSVSDLTNGGAPGDVTMAQIGDSASVRPAGLVWTTPTQMMNWATFLMHGNTTVLSDALRAEITSEQVDTLFVNGNLHYGYGMHVWRGFLTSDGTSFYPVPVWEHGGNTLTFTNDFWMLPEQDFALAITVSGYGTDFSHSVDVAIETLVELPEPVEAPMYTVDPTQFVRHVGTYSDPFNVGDMIIEDQGGMLTISMPDLDALGYDVSPELTAISSEIFVVEIDGTPFDLTFIPTTPGGNSVHVRNRSFVCSRPEVMPFAAASPLGPKAAPDRAAFDRVIAHARMNPLSRRIFSPALQQH